MKAPGLELRKGVYKQKKLSSLFSSTSVMIKNEILALSPIVK